MSDVLDHRWDNWCDLCQAEHPPCEEREYDLRYECVVCEERIDFVDEVHEQGFWRHRTCIAPPTSITGGA